MNNMHAFPPSWSNVYKKYKIIKSIGTGGMGSVYLVETLDGKKERYALKYRHNDTNMNNLARFKSELRLLKKIKSKNIPYIYDESIEGPNEHYFVMEYIEGKTLKEVIKENGRLNSRVAVTYAKQIAAGLGELHNCGIIHRDIKSENIIISNTQNVKIIDLGISLDEESQRYTKTNNVICSAYYNAPETIENKNNITKSIDVYALGIMLFEMLTGKYPYSGQTAAQTVIMHRNAEMPRIKELIEVPQSLENIIIKATAKDPNKRHKDMWEFRHDLDTCFRVERGIEDPLSLRTIKPKVKSSDIFNSKWFIIIALVVFLILLIVSIAIIFILVR
ncbi:serine/threonine-protein kinase [Mycoplasma crocodyli]|uniref:Serine/threonine-protein kinase n=1 Tax=Mycoplasma crocodyli (strain ATCC 51981 / MP145) TaxID=512564 RepID=D5E5B0_MYCCM|nr:serine/threonine-protein kinase [Mycoplasma crocodyli]ADE19718.1 serine/threonine-protein kinase [Mycoplasma crocodyli MP145]